MASSSQPSVARLPISIASLKSSILDRPKNRTPSVKPKSPDPQPDDVADCGALPIEQMALESDGEPADNARVFTTPNAKEVRGKLASNIFAVFIAGMNDAATGALIPYLQPAYDIGLLFVAIVYLVNFAGWLVAAFTNVHISARIGTGGTLVFGAILQLLAYALIFWKPPFPLFAVSFFFSGMGVAYQDAQANTFIANVNNAYRWLGFLHAAYGAGALVSPLIATTIAANTPYWHYFYLIMLGVTVVDLVLLGYTFRKGLFQPNNIGDKDTASKDLKRALSSKAVWIMSGFFFLYVGTEVTSGGWVVQFLITVRHGVPSQVGNVASGFWGGLMVGRLVLADITHKFGERKMISLYILLALAMELLFWFIPSVVANAVVISIFGFFIGPFFPVGISVLTKLLPRELHVAAIGFTSTIGQAGSAAFPFLTGAIASKAGVQVLEPILVGLLGGMCILWLVLPRVKRPSS